MRKNISGKHHPLIKGESGFDFGDDFKSDALTDEQKADQFMSKYQDKVEPVMTYSDYFVKSAKTTGHILKEVKRFYVTLVLNGSWSERKYVTVLDRIFTEDLFLGLTTMDTCGLKYDREQLRRSR